MLRRHLLIGCLFVSVASASVNAQEAHESETTIYQEYIDLKREPGDGVKKVASIIPGYLIVTKNRCPVLYGMVEECAAGLNIQVPSLVMIYQGNVVDDVAENLKLGDVRCNAVAMSLTPSLSMFFIGEDIIKDMIKKNGFTAVQLKGVIAHELSHIKHYHIPKGLLVMGICFGLSHMICPLLSNDNAKVIPIPVTSFYMGGLVRSPLTCVITEAMVFCALLVLGRTFIDRQFENEADADAASLLDDPSDFADGLDRLLVIADTKPRALDWLLNCFANHPRNCDRRAALENGILIKQKKKIDHVLEMDI